jgi:hypothetical protein
MPFASLLPTVVLFISCGLWLGLLCPFQVILYSMSSGALNRPFFHNIENKQKHERVSGTKKISIRRQKKIFFG